MANHYRVSPKYWLHARKHGWNDAQTTLGIYLLTCEHRNLEGLYRLPKPYIAADLDWPARKVAETLETLIAAGFVMYDEKANMVLIPKALKHQSPSTDKQVIGAISALEKTPRTELWDAFVAACDAYSPKLADAVRKRWGVASESHSNGIGVAFGSDSDSRVGASSSSISSSITPPRPPSGGRKREHEDFKRDLEAWAGEHLPDVDCAAVVWAVNRLRSANVPQEHLTADRIRERAVRAPFLQAQSEAA